MLISHRLLDIYHVRAHMTDKKTLYDKKLEFFLRNYSNLILQIKKTA